MGTPHDPPSGSWLQLDGHIDKRVLHAPKTGGDPQGEWTPVHEKIVRYLSRNAVGTPWANHLTLIAAVLSARKQDVQTVRVTVLVLHARFSALFPTLGLEAMTEWKNELHLPAYLRGETIPDDSQHARQQFLTRYASATKHVQSWLDALPDAERREYQQFALPVVSQFLYETLSKRDEVVQQAQEHRKAETEAVIPHFAELKAESHFRYNRLVRLRQAYQQAIQQVNLDHSNLPLDFSYEEGTPAVERLHFRLWDRKTFVLRSEHRQLYSPATRTKAQRGWHQFSDEKNEVFLELVKVEGLNGDTAPEGFWFADLLKLGLLGSGAHVGSKQQIAERQLWLRQWGYGEEDSTENTVPFMTQVPGLLTWPERRTHGREGGSSGRFIAQAQQRTQKIFVPVESLYAAATFGLLAIDLLTTTGMRSNELLQVNVLPECLIRLVDDPPPGARDQSPRIRYVLRLLPKGERTETRHNYGIGKESVRLLEKTAQMLCDHYKLQPGEPLPRIAFDPGHNRSHRFENMLVPYIFQYNRAHVTGSTMNSCIRFLLHGMVFQTSQGVPVVIKPHLLRHAFATYAVHIGVSISNPAFCTLSMLSRGRG